MLPLDNIATITSSTLSIVASIVLIVWEVKEYRRLITTDVERPIALNLSNCIIMLGLADIVACGALAISLLDHLPHMCFIQAQIMEVGELSTVLWTGLLHVHSHNDNISLPKKMLFMLLSAAISIYHLYQIRSCAHRKDIFTVAQGSSTLFLWLCVLCWGIPVVAELIALNFNLYSKEPDPWYVASLPPFC